MSTSAGRSTSRGAEMVLWVRREKQQYNGWTSAALRRTAPRQAIGKRLNGTAVPRKSAKIRRRVQRSHHVDYEGLMAFELPNFGGTLIATIIGAAIGVTGARMGERRRAHQEYEASVNAHAASIISACAEVTEDVARHDRAVTLLQQETAQRLSEFGTTGPSRYLESLLTPVRMDALLTVVRTAMLSSAGDDRPVFAHVITVIETFGAESSTAQYPDVLDQAAALLIRWRISEVDGNEAVTTLQQLTIVGPPAAGPQPAR